MVVVEPKPVVVVQPASKPGKGHGHGYGHTRTDDDDDKGNHGKRDKDKDKKAERDNVVSRPERPVGPPSKVITVKAREPEVVRGETSKLAKEPGNGNGHSQPKSQEDDSNKANHGKNENAKGNKGERENVVVQPERQADPPLKVTTVKAREPEVAQGDVSKPGKGHGDTRGQAKPQDDGEKGKQGKKENEKAKGKKKVESENEKEK